MKITYITAFSLAFFMSGCSYFTFNASMCDEIMSDPHSTIPKECRPYNEEDATKAFKNEKTNKSKDENSVEFNK
jgi:hypothetical protein